MAVRTDFVAGEVLAAADLNDTFGSKPTKTFGTAVPSSPASGDLFFDTADTPPTAKFYDGAVFQDIAAPVTEPGLVHINTTTFSAVSAININDVFTSDYNNYQIITTPTITSGSGFINLRLRVSGVDTTTNYEGSLIRFDAASTSVAYTTPITNGIILGVIRVAKSCTINLNIADPNLATATKFTGTQSDLNQGGSMGGSHTASTSFDGFTLYTSTGTASGTVRIYGYKNS